MTSSMTNSMATRLTLILTLATTSTFADETERLLAGIEGSDEAARAEARQLLPRYGMEVVPNLLVLMTDEDPIVWRAAKNVLADICHAVGVAGRESERRALADQLKSAAIDDAPYHTQKQSLRLLALTAPEGFRIRDLKQLAQDEIRRGELAKHAHLLRKP